MSHLVCDIYPTMNYHNCQEIKNGDYVLATDGYGCPKIGKVTSIIRTPTPLVTSQCLMIRTPDDAGRRDIRVAPTDCYPLGEALELLEEKYHSRAM